MDAFSNRIQLSRKTYLDKVYGCWLGKNIGGTLGAPYECRKYVNNLTFYTPVPTQPTANDDLDLQIVWLKMLEDTGSRNPTLTDFADYWLKYLSAYPWDEYGICLRNLSRGLRPPVSGSFENGYIDNMGSPIRSEIWACIAPGNPQLAACLAFKDSALDHAGGEGTYGEMFWAAVESAAFVISDPKTLIRIGLSMVPLSSLTSRVIREALLCHEEGLNWAQARDKIAGLYSNPGGGFWGGFVHPCYAIPNFGFTILGWLYGRDFGDKLLKAVNCGYDTDCTGATLGSVLGIICGGSKIPKKWIKPVGEKIILHKFTGKFNNPKTIMELVKRTEAVADKFMKTECPEVVLAEKTIITKNILHLLVKNDMARNILASHEADSAQATVNGLQVTLHYNGDPVLFKNIEKEVRISLKKNDKEIRDASVELTCTGPVKVEKENNFRFKLRTDKIFAKNWIKVKAGLNGKVYSVKFVILGPLEAKGWHVDNNVEKCPKCQGRIETCICKK